MTTETYYYCDYCGERFDNEKDCAAHEKSHQSYLTNNIHFFFLKDDGTLCELSKDVRKIHDTLDRANFVFCKNDDSWDALNQIFEDSGYCPPSDYCGYGSQLYAWDDAIDVWYDAGERITKITMVLNTIKEMLGE